MKRIGSFLYIVSMYSTSAPSPMTLALWLTTSCLYKSTFSSSSSLVSWICIPLHTSGRPSGITHPVYLSHDMVQRDRGLLASVPILGVVNISGKRWRSPRFFFFFGWVVDKDWPSSKAKRSTVPGSYTTLWTEKVLLAFQQDARRNKY